MLILTVNLNTIYNVSLKYLSMKHFYVLVYCFAAAFLVPTLATAQQGAAGTSQANLQAIDPTSIRGSYEVDRENKERKLIEHISVNYVLAGVPFQDVINMELGTADVVHYGADVVDMQGKIRAHWESTSPSHVHITAIDISTLQEGNYNLVLYYEKNKALSHKIPFHKSIVKR